VKQYFLAESFLEQFLDRLTQFGEIHGPTRTSDGVTVFGPIRHVSDLLLDYRRTLLPPKKYLLPPRQTVLTFTPVTGYRQPRESANPIVLVGLHPCDLQGIAYLDRVFLEDRPDRLYHQRRKSLTLVGLSCEPDENCFCDAFGPGPRNADLFLHQQEKGFLLYAHTPKGERLLTDLKPLLTPTDAAPLPKEESRTMATIRKVAASGETFPDNPLWDDFAARCLSCGACSVCCPTCYCFDVLENGALDGTTAERFREWDNCLFRAHGEVAGGHNFRPTRQERFHYRYRHKYLGFGRLAGIPSCVGCGRCKVVCPVEIDLTELFTRGDNARP